MGGDHHFLALHRGHREVTESSQDCHIVTQKSQRSQGGDRKVTGMSHRSRKVKEYRDFIMAIFCNKYKSQKYRF